MLQAGSNVKNENEFDDVIKMYTGTDINGDISKTTDGIVDATIEELVNTNNKDTTKDDDDDVIYTTLLYTISIINTIRTCTLY
jgi:hypothetical protein